jgi:flagellar protein FliJ
MKKFEFSLSAVLKVRIKKEEIAQNNLWEAHQLLKRASMEKESLVNECHAVNSQIRTIQKGLQKADVLVELFEYLAVVKKRIMLQEEIVEEAKFGVEIKRKIAIKAMQERKVIENIKEKKFKEWENEFFDQERKTFDELAPMQFESKIRKSFYSHKISSKTSE